MIIHIAKARTPAHDLPIVSLLDEISMLATGTVLPTEAVWIWGYCILDMSNGPAKTTGLLYVQGFLFCGILYTFTIEFEVALFT